MTLDAPPTPRRTRAGAILVGPSWRARWVPFVALGAPILTLVVTPLSAAVLQQLGVPEGWSWLLGPLTVWALLAVWAALLLGLAVRVVFEPTTRRLQRWRGPLRRDEVGIDRVVWAIGGPGRGDAARIGLEVPGEPVDWWVGSIGWDDAAFDGLRALQDAAHLPVDPPRSQLAARARALRRTDAHRAAAERVGMPWREEYAHDERAFLAEYDRVRRVLGGLEPALPGDPVRPGRAHATTLDP
ncbi:hypothetical protein JSY14_04790 [Brachybacterium sp. EF45031]|uniref:hypothetical protein n=1 Tax=Brachybacterium sillae TaxID=2810536 RepID=UPI00217DA850|nr:hypothetical protein [Brachybacterium sillae]MCS6711368.1 hypothetical protein [Brachybacterium sillae]